MGDYYNQVDYITNDQKDTVLKDSKNLGFQNYLSYVPSVYSAMHYDIGDQMQSVLNYGD